jgi:Fur family transcriptional regulator, zinc uptake regulator
MLLQKSTQKRASAQRGVDMAHEEHAHHDGHHHHGGTGHDHGAARPALTRNQTLVLGVLDKSSSPVSAYAILDALRGEGLRAPLQIYRALDKLIEAGLAHRLESMNAFVTCRHPGHDALASTAFLICERCGRVDEATDQSLAAPLGKIAACGGFTVSRATIELRGLCAACTG